MKRQAPQKAAHDQHARFRQFAVGDSVMVKNFSSGPNWLPASVVDKLGPLSYLVKTPDEQLWRRHVDHLKRHSEPQQDLTTIPIQGNTPVMYPEPQTMPDTQVAEADPSGVIVEPESVRSPAPVDSADSTPNIAPKLASGTAQTQSQSTSKSYSQRSHREPDYWRPQW